MSKPREWHLADNGEIWEATEQGVRIICRCEDLDEDAAMIWACPSLLAACERVVEIANTLINESDWKTNAGAATAAAAVMFRDAVKAAITKATGGTNA